MSPAKEKTQPEAIGAILAGILRRVPDLKTGAPETPSDAGDRGDDGEEAETGAAGRYDFDLAEFPLFHFYKQSPGREDRAPLTYADTIRGQDGKPVPREWKAYAGPFGFGGPSTHVLLYDFIQLYCEQGCCGSQIQFGTLRSLFLRRGERNPSARDYARLRRDIDVLRGYDFHCKNAFWDRAKRAYVDMNWRLFGSVFYFKERADSDQTQLPFGFIEVSGVFQQIAKTRGFFALGFESKLFYGMRPLEQRLAVYLAKKFVSQKLHRRFVDDLARALPIGAARPTDVRVALKKAAQGLLDKKLPILEAFRVEKSRDGRFLAEFTRKAAPRQDAAVPAYAAANLTPAILALVDRIVRATGNADDRPWWTQCALRLGPGPVGRALGQLKEARQLTHVKNPGGLLTKIFKDIAAESGVSLN
ncbi:MAG: hypothetical protein U0746_10550 [Gemmataceae bacterium]